MGCSRAHNIGSLPLHTSGGRPYRVPLHHHLLRRPPHHSARSPTYCVRVCAVCGPVQGGGRCWLHLFALLSLYTGTIQQLNLIHYCPQQDTKAHNSAINCLQTLENCNNSWDWDEDHIIRFARKWKFQAPVLLVDCVVVLFLSEREPREEAEDEPRGHPRRTRSRPPFLQVGPATKAVAAKQHARHIQLSRVSVSSQAMRKIRCRA